MTGLLGRLQVAAKAGDTDAAEATMELLGRAVLMPPPVKNGPNSGRFWPVGPSADSQKDTSKMVPEIVPVFFFDI